MQDEYILTIRSDGARHYYKNNLLHREHGPAIVNPLDKDKYFHLTDISLYTTTFICQSEPTYIEEDDLWEYPIWLSISTSYFINGIQYSEKEFEARKIKKELDKELTLTELENKKTKV